MRYKKSTRFQNMFSIFAGWGKKSRKGIIKTHNNVLAIIFANTTSEKVVLFTRKAGHRGLGELPTKKKKV